MSAGQFDTPEKMKEWRKAEIAQLEKDCAMQDADGAAAAAAKNKVILARLKREYQTDYKEKI